MAVYYSSTQQRSLGRLLTGTEVKAWIRGAEPVKPRSPEKFDQKRPKRPKQTRSSLVPSPAAVLTISAPQALLSASLNSFLVGFGVYLGSVWKSSLDNDAGENNSRMVFISFIVSTTFCYGIYSLSGLAQSAQDPIQKMLEGMIFEMRRNLKEANKNSLPAEAQSAIEETNRSSLDVERGRSFLDPIEELIRTSAKRVSTRNAQS